MKKKIVIACGAGLATSTMIIQKVESVLQEEGITNYSITQAQIFELDSFDGSADIFITSMKIDESKYKTPIVVGTPFLVGINEEEVKDEIIKILREE